MLNRMFYFSKTANKFETVAVAALILGLASFIAPTLMQAVAAVAVLVAIWAGIKGKGFLKVVLSAAFIITNILFLSGTIYFIAISLVGAGIAGVASLAIRYGKAEAAYRQEQREAEEETVTDNAEEVAA